MTKHYKDRTSFCINCGKKRIFATPADMRRRTKTGKCRKCFLTTKNDIYKTGEDSSLWKKEGVGYTALHYRMKRKLVKPLVCDHCKQPARLDLANISQEYKMEINDWEWLCRKCHMTKDGRLEKFIQEYNHKPENRNLYGRRCARKVRILT